MRLFGADVRGERYLVGALPGREHKSAPHHPAADAAALLAFGNHYILDERRRRPPMGDIVDDHQREGPDHAPVALGEIGGVIRIGRETGEDRLCFLERDDVAIVEARLAVEFQQRRQVGLDRLSKRQTGHGRPAPAGSAAISPRWPASRREVQKSLSEQTNMRPPRSSSTTSSR